MPRASRTCTPDNELSYTANFLSMLFKMSEPKYAADDRLVRALEILFILHRRPRAATRPRTRSGAIGSTQVDPYTAVAGGIGALLRPVCTAAPTRRMLKMLAPPIRLGRSRAVVHREAVEERRERAASRQATHAVVTGPPGWQPIARTAFVGRVSARGRRAG